MFFLVKNNIIVAHGESRSDIQPTLVSSILSALLQKNASLAINGVMQHKKALEVTAQDINNALDNGLSDFDIISPAEVGANTCYTSRFSVQELNI